MKITFERLDDSEFEKQQNQGGVGKGNERVFEQATPGIFAISLRKDLVPAFVHKHESEHETATRQKDRFQQPRSEIVPRTTESEAQRIQTLAEIKCPGGESYERVRCVT